MEFGSSSSGGVRKGAWSKIEDDLLKDCIQKFGEGKWHLVPHRTGLNRCRKSCRLRWLNYLKPDIKRGDFSEDEVDLMIRMHKLLGNRWSLIAGRLPGRTPNDVKNYWNTYMRRRKVQSEKKEKKIIEEKEIIVKPHKVIKPLPQTFSKKSPWLKGKIIASDPKLGIISSSQANATSSESKNWWETLLDDNNANNNDIFSLDYGEWKDLWDEQLTSNATNDRDFLTDGKTWSDDVMNLLDTQLFNLSD